MEQFQERLERLTELSDDEISALETEMVAAFDAADESADLENMQALADALDEVRREKSSRSVPAEEDAPAAEVEPVPAQVAASAETTTEVTTSTEVTPDPEPSTEPESAPAEPAEQPEQPESPDAEPTEQPDQPVAEGEPEPEPESDAGESSESTEGETVAEITAEDVPAENSPVTASSAPPITIRAGGDIPGITAGSPLSGMDDVVDAITRKVGAMRGITGDGEHIIVASMRVEDEVPEERTLRPGDLNGNSRKIRELISDPDQLQPDALVAAAWCAPRAPIYEIPTVGTTVRPVRDALPTFNADRGGITWMAPPTFPDLAAASAIWRYDDGPGTWGSYTNADGSGVAGETKPCLTIECGDEVSADVDALTLCLCFNNLTARAFPEWIRANTDLTMVAQSRFAEQVLLSQIFAVGTTGTCGTPATSVGAARDFLLPIRAAAASLRWRNRIGVNSPFQVLIPSWVRDAIAVDLGLQAPGDDTLSVSYATVDGYFRDMNLTPIWFTDDIPGADTWTDCTFPATADWLMFPTGAFLRLDSGELNLGVVRTKEDLQKNAYCEFSETFETVAYMGPADHSWLIRGQTAIDIKGSYSGPTTIA